MTDREIDFPQLLREIDEEVRARRAAGDFPPGMERELDLVFAHFAPPAAAGDDLDSVIEAVDRTSYIDPDPSTESRLPGVSFVKGLERKLLGWFFRFLAQQVTAFGGVVVQALKLISRRLESLEDSVPGTNPRLITLARSVGRPVGSGALDGAVVAHMQRATGRVLVAECGDGSLLRQLDGLDVYGIEPRADLADSVALTGLDVRDGELLEHLRGVEDAALGGAVLVGAVDRAPLPTKLAIVERVAAALASGGRLVVVGTDPSGWGVANPIEADLAPGRPLQPATWIHLLTENGFTDCAAVDASGTYAVTCVRV